MDSIFITNQYADNSVIGRQGTEDPSLPVMDTPLAHAELDSLAQYTDETSGVTLSEMPLPGLLVLRSRDPEPMRSALNTVLNTDLPQRLGSTTGKGICVRWVGPDEWLLSCPIKDTYDIESALQQAAGQSSIAVTNVTGGFCTLILQGDHALDVLQKSTPYDVHPDNFVAGKVVNTVFAKAQVSLLYLGDSRFEIMVRRSYADYVWHWLQVASVEFGLNIATDST